MAQPHYFPQRAGHGTSYSPKQNVFSNGWLLAMDIGILVKWIKSSTWLSHKKFRAPLILATTTFHHYAFILQAFSSLPSSYPCRDCMHFCPSAKQRSRGPASFVGFDESKDCYTIPFALFLKSLHPKKELLFLNEAWFWWIIQLFIPNNKKKIQRDLSFSELHQRAATTWYPRTQACWQGKHQ